MRLGEARAALPPALRRILEDAGPLAIAFSGGLDSRFLCHAAMLCGIDVLAIHASGPHIAPGDSAFARAWAKERDLPLLELEHDPLNLPEVSVNGRGRCRECKKNLFALVKKCLCHNDCGNRGLCDGGNAEDSLAYRPGMASARDAGVLSPLLLAGMDKADIRRAAKAAGMDLPDQRARPCLLTRLAYGMKPKAETLAALANAEEEIGVLLDADFRLRLLPAPELHISRDMDIPHSLLLGIMEKFGFSGGRIRITPILSGFFDCLEKRPEH